MRITKIKATNFKVGSFTDEVGSVTVWSGKNDSGKTSRLDAVRTVFNGGFHPEKSKSGKGLGETAELLSGDEAGLVLEFDTRTPLSVDYVCERNAWKLGKVDAVTPPTLMKSDTEFLAMTGPAQTRYICSLIASKEDESEIVEKILEVKDTLQPRTDKTDATCEDWIDTAKVTAEARAGNVTFNEWMLGFLESVKRRATEIEAAVRRYAGFTQVTTEMRSEQARIGTNLPAIETKIEGLRTRAAELQKRSGEIAAVVKGANSKTRAREQAEQFIGDNPIEVLEQQQADLKEAIERLEKTTPDGYVPKEPQSRKYKDDATLAVRAAKADVDAIKGKIGDLRAELADLMTGECCPKCKSRSQKWKTTAEVEYGKEIADAEAAQKRAESKVMMKQSELTAAEESWKEAQKADADQLTRAAELGVKSGELTATEKLITQYRESQEVIKAEGGDVTEAQAELETVNFELNGLNGEIQTFVDQRDVMVEDRGRIEQALKVEVEKAEFEDELRALKAIAKTVTTYQEEAVTKAMRGLMDKVNAFTTGIIPERIEFRDGEVGRWREVESAGRKAKQWVCHRAFGQTFQAVTYIGLSVALAAQNAFKLVMFDELGVVDQDNIEKVMLRMIELQKAGVIDQFLGASPIGIYRDNVLGLTEIELE